MNKVYCDLCEKEIKGEDYVEQNIFIHYKLNGFTHADVCKKCWEKEQKARLNKKIQKKKINKIGGKKWEK